jgi:prepilin-type N-terminal cleavage/methylation domain-containing protein
MNRSAFTLIEMLIVLTIAAILAAVAGPVTVGILQKSNVTQSAERILSVHRLARQLSLRGHDVVGSINHYGVAIVVPESGAPYATVLYGTSATDELMSDADGDGQPDSGPGAKPRLRVELPKHLEVLTASAAADPATPLHGSVAWFYQWQTGAPCSAGNFGTAVSIGTRGQAAQAQVTFASPFSDNDLLSLAKPAVPPSPVCSALALKNRGGRYQVDIAIYAIGIAHWKGNE